MCPASTTCTASRFVSRGPRLRAVLDAGGHERQLPTAAIVNLAQGARRIQVLRSCTGVRLGPIQPRAASDKSLSEQPTRGRITAPPVRRRPDRSRNRRVAPRAPRRWRPAARYRRTQRSASDRNRSAPPSCCAASATMRSTCRSRSKPTSANIGAASAATDGGGCLTTVGPSGSDRDVAAPSPPRIFSIMTLRWRVRRVCSQVRARLIIGKRSRKGHLGLIGPGFTTFPASSHSRHRI